MQRGVQHLSHKYLCCLLPKGPHSCSFARPLREGKVKHLMTHMAATSGSQPPVDFSCTGEHTSSCRQGVTSAIIPQTAVSTYASRQSNSVQPEHVSDLQHPLDSRTELGKPGNRPHRREDRGAGKANRGVSLEATAQATGPTPRGRATRATGRKTGPSRRCRRAITRGGGRRIRRRPLRSLRAGASRLALVPVPTAESAEGNVQVHNGKDRVFVKLCAHHQWGPPESGEEGCGIRGGKPFWEKVGGRLSTMQEAVRSSRMEDF